MSNGVYIHGDMEPPELDVCDYKAFREEFMKSVFLALLSEDRLTQIQYECCIENVMPKCGDNSKV